MILRKLLCSPQNSLRRNWMPEQPSVFTGWSGIQFVDSHLPLTQSVIIIDVITYRYSTFDSSYSFYNETYTHLRDLCFLNVFNSIIPVIILKASLNLLFHLEHILYYNCVQKLLEKSCKLRKSCNYKQHINKIYNEKLHYNCLQQLLTIRLTILGN